MTLAIRTLFAFQVLIVNKRIQPESAIRLVVDASG